MHLFLALAMSCTGPREGIAVGNPGDGVVQVAKSKGLELESSEALIDALSLVDCQGQSTLVAGGVSLPLDGSALLTLPGGTWCGVELSLIEPVTLRFQSGGSQVEMALELPTQRAEGAAFTMDGGRYIVELGAADWVSPEMLGAMGGGQVMVDSSSPFYADLVGSLSELHVGEDRDQDGALGQGEELFSTQKSQDGDDDGDDDADSKRGEREEEEAGPRDSGLGDSGLHDSGSSTDRPDGEGSGGGGGMGGEGSDEDGGEDSGEDSGEDGD